MITPRPEHPQIFSGFDRTTGKIHPIMAHVDWELPVGKSIPLMVMKASPSWFAFNYHLEFVFGSDDLGYNISSWAKIDNKFFRFVRYEALLDQGPTIEYEWEGTTEKTAPVIQLVLDSLFLEEKHTTWITPLSILKEKK